MIPPIDTSALPPIAKKLLDPSSPARMRLGAAKGLLPGLKPSQVVTVLALLAMSSDTEVARTAQQTLRTLPAPLVDGALHEGLAPAAVDTLAQTNLDNQPVLMRILDAGGAAPETVASLAQVGSEELCERIATNESLLLAHPMIIERLYMNKAVRMSTADRVLELAVRNGIELAIPAFQEAAAAIKNELVAEPSGERTPDDELFFETKELAETIRIDAETEDTHERDEDGNEQVTRKFTPLWVKINTMTVSQKIRMALLGTAGERMLLVRDTNRLVSMSAIRSPQIKEAEVVQISASRAIADHVLGEIARNKKWNGSRQVQYNLVTNPRTPFAQALRFIAYLSEHELKLIAKSKNVSPAIATAARQHLSRKKRN